MSYRDIQKMSEEAFTDLLVDDCYAVLDDSELDFDFLKQDEGHADMHFSQTDAELIDRIIHENKRIASCFFNPKDAKQQIANALLYKVEDVATWLFKEEYECSSRDDFTKMAITVDMRGDEPVGRGFSEKLREYKTNAITVVFRRDFEPDSLYGFRLLTAYPEFVKAPQCVKATGKQYTPEYVVENAEIFSGTLDKLASLYRLRHPEKNIHLQENSTTQAVVYRFEDEKTKDKYDVYIEENDYSIRKRATSGNTRTSLFELGIDCPKQMQFITDILNDRDRIKKGIKLKPPKEEKAREREEHGR